MKTIKISRSIISITILTISTFSTIQSSDSKQPDQDKPLKITLNDKKNSITFTRNKNPDKPQKPGIFNGFFSSDKTDESDTTPLVPFSAPIVPHQPQSPAPADFDMPEQPPKQPVAAKTPVTPAFTPAPCTDMLGITYPTPALPEQNATGYAWSDRHLWRSDEDYVLGLIANGTYNYATSGPGVDTKLPGRNSNGLLSLVSKLVDNQTKQRTVRTELLKKQRDATIEDTNAALLLLFALNQTKDPKKIDAARLEAESNRIQEERENLTRHALLTLQEFFAQDQILKRIQNELQKAHLTGEKSLPLSPRKTLPEFTRALLPKK